MPLRLILPHIVGLVLIVIVWVSSPQQVYAYIPVLHETMELSIPVEYNILIKIVLSAVILIVVLFIHLLRDYSRFMPKSWTFKVFFAEDLETVVQSFSAKERTKLLIPDDWQKYRIKFIDYLNQLLEEYNVPEIAKFDKNTLGTGTFSYQCQKVPGQQKYHLYDGHGFLEFEFSSREESITVLTQFQQHGTGTDYVEPSMLDLFYRFNTLVAPTFSQHVTVDPYTRHNLVAIKCPTRIRFLPTIDISRTLYLFDIRELQSTMSGIPEYMPEYMIPYAYAVNHVPHPPRH